MSAATQKADIVWRLVLWIGRLAGLAAIVPLMMIFFGEPGTEPIGWREIIYLALFPFGFSAGYLLSWRWPVAGGSFSLACMVASLLVIGRSFGAIAYLIWLILCIPGVMMVLAGLKLHGGSGTLRG